MAGNRSTGVLATVRLSDMSREFASDSRGDAFLVASYERRDSSSSPRSRITASGRT